MDYSLMDFIVQHWFSLLTLALSLVSLAYSYYVYYGAVNRRDEDDCREEACRHIPE
nr:MAG TPA: hypothetical protein [Caudoviricetes sp.]